MSSLSSLFPMLLIVLAAARADQASGPPERITVEGTLELTFTENPMPPTVHAVTHLRTREGDRHRLHVPLTARTRPGSRVRVEGLLSGAYLDATTVTLLDAVSDVTENTTTGEQSTVVILVNSVERPLEPLSVETVSGRVFGTEIDTLNAWVRDLSSERAQVAGIVVGWYTLDVPESALCTDAGLEAAFAAANPDVYFPDFLRVVLLYPSTAACPGGGSGSWGLRTGLVDEDENNFGPVDLSLVTLNGVVNFDNGILEHEFGHSLGLLHATDWECGDAATGSDESCEAIPYSDQFDVMGTFRAKGHFSALHLHALGWIDPDEVVTVISPGHYTLLPLQSSETGAKALRIPTADGRAYFVEYRRPEGYDAASWVLGQQRLGIDVFRGPMIRIDRFLPNPGTGASDSQLLDLSPHVNAGESEQQDDSLDAVLPPGRWFSDPANGVALTTIAATDEGATIFVGNQPGIPASSHWGMVILALLFLGSGTVVQRARSTGAGRRETAAA